MPEEEKEKHTAKKISGEYLYFIPIIICGMVIIGGIVIGFLGPGVNFFTITIPGESKTIPGESKFCFECGTEHSIGGAHVKTKFCSGCNEKKGIFHECYFCKKCDKIHDLSRYNGPGAVAGGRWCYICCAEVSTALGSRELHCCQCGGQHKGSGCPDSSAW